MNQQKKSILIFGNPLLENDNLPLKLMPKLKNIFPDIAFQEIDSTENLSKFGKDLTIIDTVEGIDNVMLIDNIEQLHANKDLILLYIKSVYWFYKRFDGPGMLKW